MTAKEKATELVEKFLEHTLDMGGANSYAKQCALICVEEILKLLGTQYAKITDAEGTIMWKYWQEVKAEIEAA